MWLTEAAKRYERHGNNVCDHFFAVYGYLGANTVLVYRAQFCAAVTIVKT